MRWAKSSTASALLEWAAIIVAGTGLISLQFISVLMLADGVPPNQAAAAFLRYWLGDMVGILATMPLLWMLADERGRLQLRTMIMSWESLGLVATGVALWLAFGLDEVTDFKYFYVLFLPIAWAAARKGLAGAVLITLFAQLGVIIETRLLGFSALALSEIQTLVLVLALSGFFIGVLVDEKQRLGAELRQTLRLAAAGEMAGALAHELNQPLTALAIYGKACERLLEQGETGERLREVIARMVAESLRAAEVVGRLRDFFRTGGTRLERIWLHELLSAAADRFTARAQQQGVELIIEPAPACALWADRLQLEVVLRNLLSNAFDAVAEQPTELRHIRLSTYPDGAGRIGICVEDSGAGLSGEMVARLFEPFQSSKASGLGLGLAISRAIIEAHGGSLWAEVTDHGLFRLVLPIEGTANDDS
jgi:two-component system sensor kinase FixL